MADKRCSSQRQDILFQRQSNELFFDLKHSVDSNYLTFVQQFM